MNATETNITHEYQNVSLTELTESTPTPARRLTKNASTNSRQAFKVTACSRRSWSGA
jgi:hypothetical protein